MIGIEEDTFIRAWQSAAEDQLEKILVIKLGALGDFVQSMGAFEAIRNHHKQAEMTLMTTLPFETMAKDCGYFDKVWIDQRRPFYDIRSLLRVRRFFKYNHFNRVYDLQCVSRTNKYFNYLIPSPKPQWSGLAQGCSHPHTDVNRPELHTYDRHRQQLKLAGIGKVPDPHLDWVKADASKFKLPANYVLLIPGAAPGGESKKWPADKYGELAKFLVQHKYTPVVLGTQNEHSTAKAIQSICPEVVDLTGKTSLYEVVELARHAKAAVGNDTGPTHMVAQVHCPITVLFSNHSEPGLFGPAGAHVQILQRDHLKDLTAEEVWGVFLRQLQGDGKVAMG